MLPRQYRTTNSGFTLIEVLLAVFIGSIVVGVLYASFFQIIKAKEKTEEELELYHEARVVFSRLTRDLSTVFPRGDLFAESAGVPYPYFLGAQDGDFGSVRFTSLSRRPSTQKGESDQTEVTYYLQGIENSDLYALMRRDNPRIGTENGGTEYPISERVAGFYLNYIGSANPVEGVEDIITEWDSSAIGSLPRAVNVTLVMRGPRGEDHEFSSLILIPVVD